MSDWPTRTLRDLIAIKHGYAFKGEYFSDTGPGPLLVTPGNFSIGGGFKNSKQKFYTGPIPEGFLLSSGDLMVTMTDLSKFGDTLGYPALVPADADYLHNQRIGLVSISNPNLIKKEFLYYLLCASNYRQHVIAGASGSTVRHTSPDRIRDFSFSCPGIQEQVAIARVLRVLDDKIVVNERITVAALELAEAYFLEVSISSERKSSSIGDLVAAGSVDFGDGYRTKRSEHGRPGIPILRVAEVLDGRIEAKFEDFVHEDYRKSMQKKTSRPGDIVLTTKGTVGRVAVVGADDPEFVYSPQLCYFRVYPSAPFSPSYFHLWLRSDEFRRQAAQMKGQTDMADYLSIGDIKRLRISFPDHARGSQVTAVLHQLEGLMDSRLRENRTLAELRDTLLPKLISGEIKIKDAEKDVENVI
ncbi:restriction endonuclease subunit S [Streptosporangium sp. CA-115845]|uniref:restriction endonuclease subunit S n=1 Tax=Streptosporangium sp. CA-115845 TaxID=3240071 RepID=UPI003D8D088D